jgi:centromere/kinetochore protein ZW10
MDAEWYRIQFFIDVYISKNYISAKSLFESCRRMLDLFRILLKDSEPYSSLPVMAMVLFNDFLYLQRECLLLPLNFPKMPMHLKLADRAGKFRQDALILYQTQMDLQKKSMKEIMDSIPNLHIQHAHQLEGIERMIHQVTFHIRSVSQPWSSVLSSHMHKKALGELLSFCFDHFIKELQELKDITEKESRELHQLLSRFKEFTADFKTRDPDELLTYIPSMGKFLLIVDILEMNMADIMSLFRQQRLLEFSPTELVSLIKALFADTPLRTKNLLEITSGTHSQSF